MMEILSAVEFFERVGDPETWRPLNEGTKPEGVAWFGCVLSIGRDVTGVYRAVTAGKAKGMVHRHVSDAYEGIPFTECRVRRAPQYDGVEFKSGTAPQWIDAP